MHVAPGVEYQATTTQVCGLYPFVAGAGTPSIGTPVGRHQLSGEVVCLDPLTWLRVGLVTNPGVFVLGQPGTGKSTLVKRMVVGAVAFGSTALILGDTKPDCTPLVAHLGGQVISIGRGMDRLNPLDAGPLAAALGSMSGPETARLRWEVRGRRLSLLLALCTLIRESWITNFEEVVLGRAVDLLDERLLREPTVPDVLTVIEEGPEALRSAARADTDRTYRERTWELLFTLDLLCTGSLAGVFDGPTTRPLDLPAPAVAVDISRIGAAGDKLLTAAMLSTWAYSFAMVDACAALSGLGLAPRRSWLGVMDELWRALRGAPGLVEYADALTRLNRAKGMASVMVTHSLADLDALTAEEDRAKARGFADRSAITVLAGLPPRELARVSEVTPLTGPEAELVASWSAPDSWQPGARHPGRGKYLIKTGERLGIPVELSLVGEEYRLYDTDPKFDSVSGRLVRSPKGLPEIGEGEAVTLACVADLAAQEQFADGLAEANAAVQTDQPRGGQAGPPVAAQEFAEVLVADVTRVVGEGGLEPMRRSRCRSATLVSRAVRSATVVARPQEVARWAASTAARTSVSVAAG